MPFEEINVKEIVNEKMKDPEFRAIHEFRKMERELISQAVQLRKSARITQKKIAREVKTNQQSISRMERGIVSPSLDTYCRYAESLGYELKLVKKTDSEK